MSVSSGPKLAYAKAKAIGLRKPFLADLKAWIRYNVVLNEQLYKALSENIQLEFIISGEICNWRGTGDWLDHYVISQALLNDPEEAHKRYPPLLIGINCGFRYENFIGTLDGLNENGVVYKIQANSQSLKPV
jgi:hypothetical protein